MSMNPPAPKPTKTEEVKYAASTFWRKHEEAIVALIVFVAGVVTGAALSQ